MPCLSGAQTATRLAKRDQDIGQTLLSRERNVFVPVHPYQTDRRELTLQDGLKGSDRDPMRLPRKGNELHAPSFPPVKRVLPQSVLGLLSEESAKTASRPSSTSSDIHFGVIQSEALRENLTQDVLQ